ncbi:MAG: IclR family transcriptional regulator [Propionibacteriaceae bacterium]
MAPIPEDERPATSPVESIDRALRVLQALAAAGPQGRSLGGLATTLDINKTTLHRILGALRFRDFVSQSPRSANYALGPATLGIGEGFFSDENLPALLHPALVALSNDVDELVHLGSLSGAYVVYLDKVEPEHSIRVWSSIGQRMPAATTAMGRALLSAQDTDRTLLMSYLKAVKHRSDVDPDSVWRAIEQARDRGYATEEQENEPGISCVAVPLLWSGRPIAAVSVTAPAERMTSERIGAIHDRMVAKLPHLLPSDFSLPQR